MNRSESNHIIDQVEAAIGKWLPGESAGPLILGVSGGPDSMTLLYALHRLDVETVVVHCNYQLRGSDSDQDQHLVEQTASMWGYDAVSVRLDPEEGRSGNFQLWARMQRYRIFRDLKEEFGARAIATAHHQDDQLETIIQKILRGSGLTAWQGMKVWDGDLFRPLLSVSKAEILQFASANHVPYRLDGSNEQSTYARNFLRNGWFPVLDDLFPGWRDNILKVPDRAREHEAVVKSLIRSLKAGERAIHRDRLIGLTEEVRRPLVLQILKTVDPKLQVSAGALKNLEQLEGLQTGKRLEINDRWSLIRDRDRFLVAEDGELSGSEESQVLELEALVREPVALSISSDEGLKASIVEWDGEIDQQVLQMDSDRLSWPLRLKAWENGDSINPLGMEGRQKISDLLTNQKVSVADRAAVRVLEAGDGEICAVLYPRSVKSTPGIIADWVRCTGSTEQILQIRRQ